jgi:hypothetical protein
VKLLKKIRSDDRRVRVTALEHLAFEAVDRIAAPTYFEPQCAPSRYDGYERVRMEVWRGIVFLVFEVTRSLFFQDRVVRERHCAYSNPNLVTYPSRFGFAAGGRGKLSRELGFTKIFHKNLDLECLLMEVL